MSDPLLLNDHGGGLVGDVALQDVVTYDQVGRQRASPKRAHFLSSVANLSNAAVGAGILGLPFAFYKAGIIWATLLMILVVGCTCISFYMMARMSQQFQCRSYDDVSAAAFGVPGRVVGTVCLVVYYFCVLWAYVILIGNFLTLLFLPVCGATCIATNRYFMVGLVMALVILPLSTLKRMHHLRVTSYVALVAILLAVVVIVVRFAVPYGARPAGTPVLFQFDVQVVLAFPIMLLAFAAQGNVVSIHYELGGPDRERSMAWVIITSVLICFCFYFTAGLMGYLLFPTGLTGDVFLSFDPNDPLAIVARVGVLVSIVFSYPVVFYPAREVMFSVVFLAKRTASSTPRPRWGWVGKSDLLARVILTVSFGVVLYLLGVFLPQVGIVFEIAGATFGVAFSLVLPAVCWIKTAPPGTKWHSPHCWLAYLIMTVGTVFGLVALGSSIYELAMGHPI
ncbi:Transmembrane amino acid transporter [Paratrimastix pyriformis]|uniref:Transmembrane amino acid transporter n=1 Tax=Paratrimastix pyriformis TaxID=342808 RepID=A0ABQ8UTA3_9EUKA|nr:Transmembrane amino acid transporter [Paratrimastix pyriformis]